MKRLCMIKRLLFAITSLSIGILIYVFYNCQHIHKSNYILTFIRNFLPDCLWMISFFLVSVVFMRRLTNRYMFATAIYTFIFSIVFELSQLFGFVKGTFDLLDIGVYFVAISIAYTIEKYIFRGNNYEEN